MNVEAIITKLIIIMMPKGEAQHSYTHHPQAEGREKKMESQSVHTPHIDTPMRKLSGAKREGRAEK